MRGGVPIQSVCLHGNQGIVRSGAESAQQLWQSSGNSRADIVAGIVAAEILRNATTKPEVERVDAVAHLVWRRAARAILGSMVLDLIAPEFAP